MCWDFTTKQENNTHKNNEDLFGRNIKYEKIAIDESFPKYIFNNKAMFKEWIV